MSRFALLLPLLFAGCAPGVVQAPMLAGDPRVFTGVPECPHETLGSFTNAPDLRREIDRRGGDAVIQVREQEAREVTGDIRHAPRHYSGMVVRFTDPNCTR
jgi:hypothetical protein